MPHTGRGLGPLLFSGRLSFTPIIFHVLKDTTQGNADGGAGTGLQPPSPPPTSSASPAVGGVVDSYAGSVIDWLHDDRTPAVGAELSVHLLPLPPDVEAAAESQASGRGLLSLVSSLS